jgi:hypothetical protein
MASTEITPDDQPVVIAGNIGTFNFRFEVSPALVAAVLSKIGK